MFVPMYVSIQTLLISLV